MIKQFELFERMSAGRQSNVMRVSLNQRGTFSLNQKAFDDLGKPDAVELFFDKINKLIGMRPCSPQLKHAYPARRQGKNRSYLVRAMSFCNYYNIKIVGTVIFTEPEVEDGMLILALANATQVAQRKAKKKSAPDQERPFLVGAA
jgi:hypothetical protein